MDQILLLQPRLHFPADINQISVERETIIILHTPNEYIGGDLILHMIHGVQFLT